MRRLFFTLVLLAGCSRAAATGSTIATSAASLPPGSLQPNATLERVIDGDTIDIDVHGTRERVRLIGIDTPETVKPNTPVQCFGPEASAHTKSLLPKGTRLHVERDVEPRDKYQRVLAYVYRADDGLFVNLDIIGRGFARLLTIPPNVAHVDDFVAAARTARQSRLGLWTGCSG
jgi:micrococcal nuclease